MSKNMTIVLAAMGVVIIGGVGYLIFGERGKNTTKDQPIVQVVPGDNGSTAGNTPPATPAPAPATQPTPPAPEVTKTPEPAPVAGGTNPGKIDIALFFQNGQVKPAAPDATPTVQIGHPSSPAALDSTTRPSVQTHVVAAGESFSSIAAQVYGNSKYVGKLMAANPNIDPHRLRVGMTIVIPELSSSTAATSADATTPTAPAATATVDTSNGYKVQPGDTLEGIAVKLYGQSAAKFDIYTANKALIGPNPDRLKVGWVLKLPANPTTRPSN